MKKKKSFTLVELLVVIAILAILSTIGVVGYTSFKDRAAIAADKYYVNSVNTLLREENISTVNELYYVLANDGDTLESPQADGHKYVFDPTSKRVLYVDEDNNVINDIKNYGDQEDWYDLDYDVVLVEESSTSTYDDLFK